MGHISIFQKLKAFCMEETGLLQRKDLLGLLQLRDFYVKYLGGTLLMWLCFAESCVRLDISLLLLTRYITGKKKLRLSLPT
jgi:hypothetical protein